MSFRPARTRSARTSLAPVVGVAAGALVLGAVALAPPVQAATDASGVVISEVYGGGGSASSALARDYVELYNPTSSPVDLSGLSVQYRSSGGTANPTGVTPLSGTIPAGGHFLVGEGKGTAGAAVPTPDVDGAIAMSGTAGTVFLARQTTALTSPRTGSLTGDPAVLDLVGYGSTNTFEKAPTAAPSATTSVQRTATGADTDDNSADLAVAAGTPTPTSAGGGTPDPDPTPGPAPVERTIAQVQGTGPSSPYAGQAVTVEGVVTAAYPTGGINSFYLQTAGTGADLTTGNQDAHTASDAVLVYGSAATAKVAVGDHVRVTGKVSEFQGTTEITPTAADVTVLPTPATVTPAKITVPRTEAGREAFEGMLLAPQGPFTVADNYGLNSYGEVGLASGTTPLVAPTEVADAQDTATIARLTAENDARAVTLDDGATVNFLGAGKDAPLPYLTQDHQVRVGAPVTFAAPVVLEDRYDVWRLQPTSQLTGEGTLPVTFGHTRTAAPEPVGGNVKIASFNVLNYFPTTGDDVVAAGGSCSFYKDRAGDPVTVNTCRTATGGDGPRGAAEDEDLARQQAKIVAAIDGLGADVVSLEEIENSAKFGKDRDAAVGRLVAALNAADPGSPRGDWRFVPSPASANSPEAQADEDVIRTAFIYRSGVVGPVGESVIDDVPTFDTARDPLAQAFQPVGAGTFSRFTVVVNHLKSKGSGVDDGTGQGNSNPTRVAQAKEVVRFADAMRSQLGTDRQFLTGDFNAYTQEDPLQELYAAGWTDIGSALHPDEHTYLFGGRVGSLDHVLGNAAAMRSVTGAHVWNLSSVESVALEYSRVNYNATDLYEPGPYRSSDHDPLLVGVSLPTGPVATTTTATVDPDPVEFKRDHPVVTVRVATDPADLGTVDEGTVEVREGGVVVGRGTVADGVARVELPTTNKKGRHELTVTYVGTDDAARSTGSAAYDVVKTGPVGPRP